MKKKILKTILVIIILLVIGIGYVIYIGVKQGKKLANEFQEMSNLISEENIDFDSIDDILDRTVTTGDLAIFEDAFKSYFRELFETAKKVHEVANDDKMSYLFTPENYTKDGKDFVETRNYLNTTRKTLEECKAKFNELSTQEKLMSYIENKGLDSVYIDIYRKEFAEVMEQEDFYNTVVIALDGQILLLDSSQSIINFLVDNKENWEMQGEYIVFNSEDLTNQYNQLIDKDNELIDKINGLDI